MGIIGWVIIGALAGWIASLITGNDKKMGAGMNIRRYWRFDWGTCYEPDRGLRYNRV